MAGRAEMRNGMPGKPSLQPTASAVVKGRTLDSGAVGKARAWREKRIKELLSRPRLELSRKERNEARGLTGRWDFWNYKGGLL